MRSRKVGTTKVEVSEVALGTWGLAANAYGEVLPSQFDAVVKAAWEAGITTFDLAPTWGDGESEWRTAAALGDHLQDAILITRAGRESALEGGRYDSQGVIDSVEWSLKRMRRSMIDVVLLHNPPLKALNFDFFAKGIQHLLDSGKIRAWGVSVGTTEDAQTAIECGAQVVDIVHHMLDHDVMSDIEADLGASGATVIARSPLAYGLLSGTWAKAREFDEADHRSRRWTKERFERRLDQVESLRFLVREGIDDLSTAALRFALSSPLVSTVTVGARTAEQAAHAAQASVEPPYLTDTELMRIDELV